MLATTELSQQPGRPYTPRPRTPRTSQASRSSKYPTELSAHSPHPHNPHQHRYEGFEELLREAGYKEIRIFTPERERVSSKTESAGKNENKRAGRGGERADTTKLRSVVGFLAGFLASGHSEQGSNSGDNFNSSNVAQPPSTTTPLSPSLAPPSPNMASPGTPQQAHGDIHMHSPSPSNHSRNNLVYLQNNASYTSVASTATATQPKYLRSAHMQHRQRQNGGATTSNNPAPHHSLSRSGSSSGLQRQHSDMLPPPVPPLPSQYRDQNNPSPLPTSRPGTPPRYHSTRPNSRAQSRPSTPSAHPPRIGQTHSTPGYRDPYADRAPRLQSTRTEPLPTSHERMAHPMPSKAHAYLKHMASMQRILEGPSNQAISLSDSMESTDRPATREGETEETPKPRPARPRSTPGGPLKGLNLWASFTSSSSVNSHSSGSSGFASQSTTATSPPTSSGMGRSVVLSPEQDDGSEPDEEAGGYFDLIRSRSQSRSRADSGRPRIHADDVETPGARWWKLRQTKSMMQVKVQEEDEGSHPTEIRRRKSYLGVRHPTPKPMVDSTNLAVPTPSRAASASPSPALPYLVTRLSSPAPPETSEHSRGRTQAKKTRVYCRSQSVPRQGVSGRSRRWGLGGNTSTPQEPVPILMANTSSDSESVNEEDDQKERYFSGWGLDSDASASASLLSPPVSGGGGAESVVTPTLEVPVPSPPPRQNSIRSLRRHLKLDEQHAGDAGDVPPVVVLTAGRGQARPRGGLPGGWHS
ncbi:hypothetical protein AAF712_003260 [Marasmius tenuissimus]|uniref:Uncharacterized protein n=1 Tax=Marasmius tenuissimus TaxID=585030 RepID=A0ABR3A6J7_9AGAR